jgi:hypothetical protein
MGTIMTEMEKAEYMRLFDMYNAAAVTGILADMDQRSYNPKDVAIAAANLAIAMINNRKTIETQL